MTSGDYHCGDSTSTQTQDWAYMDRISYLPNSVLSHILSFLPTKLAASTSVLSKRWRFLWTLVPNFDLEGNAIILNSRLQQTHVGRTTSFENLVNGFFCHRDKKLCLKKFRLKFMSMLYNSTRVDSWVLSAMSCRVEELDLDLSFFNTRYTFCFNIFACETLVALKLSNGITIRAPRSSISLPSLKVLHLLFVEYENSDSLGNLISGCPLLENLVLRNQYEVTISHGTDFVISSPSLKDLLIEQSYGKPIRFVLDAPSLEHLSFYIGVCKEINLKNLDNLVQAEVNIYLDYNCLPGDAHPRMVEDFLGDLYNVQVLTLEQPTMQLMHEASSANVPVFHNLVQLELHGFDYLWPMLLSLLQKVPYIQFLTIHAKYYQPGYCSLGSDAWAELEVPDCLSRLRKMCFNGAFKDHELSCCDSLEFLTFVLNKSIVLEHMTITCCSGLSSDKKHAFQQKLASLERGSTKCQLKFEGEVL